MRGKTERPHGNQLLVVLALYSLELSFYKSITITVNEKPNLKSIYLDSNPVCLSLRSWVGVSLCVFAVCVRLFFVFFYKDQMITDYME